MTGLRRGDAAAAWRTTCGTATPCPGTTWCRITRDQRQDACRVALRRHLPVRAPAACSAGARDDPAPAPTPNPRRRPRRRRPRRPPRRPSAWAGYTEGIDISHWQGTIDWTQVAAAGKRFAYMKASESIGLRRPDLPDEPRPGEGATACSSARTTSPGRTLAVGDAVAEADHFVDTASPAVRRAPAGARPRVDNGGLAADAPGSGSRTSSQRVYERTGIRAAIYVSPSFWTTRMGNTRLVRRQRLPDAVDRPLDVGRRRRRSRRATGAAGAGPSGSTRRTARVAGHQRAGGPRPLPRRRTSRPS